MVEARKRIAMVAYTFYASDARVRRHVSALVGDGYDVDVMVLANPDGPQEKTSEHVRFFFPRRRRFEKQKILQVVREYMLFTLACSFLLVKNHLRRRYSLVHINNMPSFLIFAALPLRLVGVRVLLDVHDGMSEVYQDRFGVPERHRLIRLLLLEERISMKLASFVTAATHTLWERLISNGLARDRSIVTLNVPDSSVFPETPIPETPGAPGGAFRLVYHGTLTRRLGVDVAIRAVGLAKDRIPNLRLEIIGDGEQRAELVALVDELNLGDHVVFSPGFIPTDELPKALEGSDLAVVPSRDQIGTKLMLPTKLLECVRLGIPAVTVATPTITYYFGESQVRFFPSEDAAALADQIVFLYEHPDERLAMARRARMFYSKYSFETERERYLELVARLVRRKRGGAA